VWWEVCGESIPLVRMVAIRILSQPCKSSACERNWSAFEATQTKTLNRLTQTMLTDIVYIRVNSKMMAASRENEIRDCDAINLKQLGSLPEEVFE
ncbi:hypothetical protein AMTR_s00180p00046680, partial [Amborella trichopoda]